MAEPLMPQEEVLPGRKPARTVLAAKIVDLALVGVGDERGVQITQLAVVGDSKVHLLEGREMGFSRVATPQGVAADWLRNGVFEKLGKQVG
jgi:hypothetical protein